MFWKKKSAVTVTNTRELVLTDLDGGEWSVEYRDDDDFGTAALDALRTRRNGGNHYPTREELDADLKFALSKLVERYGEDTPENLPEKAETDEDILTLSNLFQRRSAESALREAYAQDLEFVTDLETLLEETKGHFEYGELLTTYQKEMATYLLALRASQFDNETYEVVDISDSDALWKRAEEQEFESVSNAS